MKYATYYALGGAVVLTALFFLIAAVGVWTAQPFAAYAAMSAIAFTAPAGAVFGLIAWGDE